MKLKMIFAAILLSATVFLAIWQLGSGSDETFNRDLQQSTSTQDEEEIKTPKKIRIVATGDMIPHDTVNLQANNSTPGYLSMLEPVAHILRDGDLTICNPETATAGESYGISGYPSFNSPQSFIQALSDVGCNVISLANNHIGDRGSQGIAETYKSWSQLKPLAISGTKNSKYYDVIEIEGKKIAFMSFTELTNNRSVANELNMLNEDSINAAFSKLDKAQLDYIIVAAHWGNESNVVTDSQMKLAKVLAKRGANLVIGNGPHQVQKYELIEEGDSETHVFYSLGNALNTQLGIEQLTGIFAIVDLYLHEDSIAIERIGYTPVYMHYEWSQVEENTEDLLARKNLKLVPVAESDALLAKTRFGTNSETLLQQIRDSLGESTLHYYSPEAF